MSNYCSPLGSVSYLLGPHQTENMTACRKALYLCHVRGKMNMDTFGCSVKCCLTIEISSEVFKVNPLSPSIHHPLLLLFLNWAMLTKRERGLQGHVPESSANRWRGCGSCREQQLFPIAHSLLLPKRGQSSASLWKTRWYKHQEIVKTAGISRILALCVISLGNNELLCGRFHCANDAYEGISPH